MTLPTLVLDTEVYSDYLLASFLNVATGNVRHVETYPGQEFDADLVARILSRHRIVTFNGTGFDLPVLGAALEAARQGSDTPWIAAKSTCDDIILRDLRPWQLGIEPATCDHIDLIEVAPGIASLKIYGGRMHSPTMQDLPIDPSASITAEDRVLLRQYCENDLRTTAALFAKLGPQIALREQMGKQYGLDLRSKSDAQIAEAVIRHEVEASLKRPIRKPASQAGKSFKYTPPAFLVFDNQVVAEAFDVILRTDFTVQHNGVVKLPEAIADLEIAIGGSVYRMGIGGLHSSEKSVAHVADSRHILVDRDVASYYPSIILNQDLAPENMGGHFSRVYRDIVDRRLAAKRSGDTVTADTLKIVINGSFGKFGSPYSILYSPTLLIQTTITGQLALLMLIEQLEAEGIPVVSANTDGIVIKCPKDKIDAMDLIVWEWETVTRFETEATEYSALYSRDVNNYVAIKPDGKAKLKGVYAPAGMMKNPSNQVVAEAVVAYLKGRTPIEDTIHAETDVRKFLTIRTVKGGAVKEGEFLGKAVRWYYAKGETGIIQYKLNGYTVPRSEGARPLMTLPDAIPADIDLDWYIREADDALVDLGVGHA